MAEKLISLDLPPGLYNTGTVLQSKDRWFAGNLVRFFQGTKQPVGGWVQRTLTGATIVGTPNAAFAWERNDGASYLAIGTDSNLYIITDDNVVHDITPTTGIGGAPFQWKLETFGSYLLAAYTAPSSLAASNTSPIFDGITYYAWTGDVDAPIEVPQTPDFLSSSLTAPTAPYSLVVTPERFLMLLRGSDPINLTEPPNNIVDGNIDGVTFPNYSVRRVYWASQETITDWIPTDENTAGSFDLATEGTLICGRAGRGQTYIWTTVDMWTATYVGGDFIYAFERVGNNCGILGLNAAVVLDTGACWMGVGRFYRFDGYVKPLECEVADYVFNDFNSELAPSLVWALVNPRFGEITWFYPAADSTEADHYVTYNYQENHWSFGALSRACGVTRQPGAFPPVPVLVDSDGNVYDHETGDDRGDDAVYLESGPMHVGEGDNVVRVQQVIPDDKTLGDVQVQFYTSFYPDETEVLHGPFALRKQTSVRFTARQLRLRIEEVIATSWRVGVVRLGAIVSGRR